MKTSLIPAVLCLFASHFLSSAQAADCLAAPAGLVGWWSGDNHARDLSGHANHANLPTVSYADPAKVGPGFDFDGISSRVMVPPSTDLNVRSLTFAAWIHPRTGEYRPIMMFEQPGQFNGALFWTGGGSGFPDPGGGSLYANLRQAPGMEQVIHAPGVIAVGQWSFVAVTFDQPTGQARLYVNNQVVAEVTTPGYFPDTAGPLHIGYSPANSQDITRDRHFDGLIDEVQVYNRALSAEELNAIFSADDKGLCRSLTPVPLTQPTATFSQTEFGDFSIAHTVDGILDGPGAWGIHPDITNQTAAFEAVSDVGFTGGTVLNFDLLFNHPSVEGSTSHTIGRFRLSATTDLRDEFADGLPSNGDVTANWLPLEILSATAKSGATLTVLPDNSILVSGTLSRLDSYTVTTSTRLTGITGFRLEVMEDSSLPHDGPGREPINGNFALSEFLVTARPGGAPLITLQSGSLDLPFGSPATFTVSAESSLPVSFQWFHNGVALLDATNNTLNIDSVEFSHAGTYTVRVSNDEGNALSSGAVLNVLPEDASEHAALSISNQQPTAAPVRDINGNLLSGPAFFAQAYVGPTANTLLPQGPVVPFLTGDLAGFFHPIELILTNLAPGANAVVQVRAWQSAAPTFEQAVEDGLQHGVSSILQTPTGGGGNPPHQLQGLTAFSLIAAPQLLSHPTNVTAFVGGTATFQVGTVGSQPLTFFWILNSNLVATLDSPTLTLTNLTVENSGEIYVIVSNSVATATSLVATLTVLVPDTTPPQITITSPVAGPTYETHITLSGTITDDRALDYAVWQRNSTSLNPIDTAQPQFSFPNIALVRGTNIFRVAAGDTSGNTASNEVVVISLAPRSLYLTPLPTQQEGSTIEVPVFLANRGGIGGASFRVEQNVQLLADPAIQWQPVTQGAVTQFTTNQFGYVVASFGFTGQSISTGEVHIATITFRARSVQSSANTPLRLILTSLFDPAGNQVPTGSFEVRGSSVLITSRRILGDNNANHRLDVGDASTMMRFDNLVETPRFWDTPKNDLNSNNDIDFGDVIKVLRAATGLDPQPVIPPGTPPVQEPVSAAKIKLRFDKPTAAPGEQIKLTLQLTNNTAPLAAASFHLHYPTNALRLLNAAAHQIGSIVPNTAAFLWNIAPDQTSYVTQNGSIALAVSSDRPWTLNNGNIAEFTFTVQPGATHRSSWPISVTSAEISTGYNLQLVSAAEIVLVGREPLPPGFSNNPILNGDRISLSFTAEAGLQFRIEFSDDLSTWSPLTTITATGAPITHEAPLSPAQPHRFYRAVAID